MDVESNLTLDSNAELSYTSISPRIVQEVVLTLFFIVLMCVDVAIFYIIFAYKRLRTVPNIFFANWAIADLLCVMVTPSGYKILSVIAKNSISHEFLCFIDEFAATFHVTVNLFVIVVLVDWFIAAYFGRTSEKLRDHYVWIISSVWVFAIVFGSTSAAICFHFFSAFLHHVVSLFGTYILITLLVICLQISRIVQKLRHVCVTSPTLNLTFGTVYVLCAVLTVMQMFGAVYRVSHPALEALMIATLFGTNYINFGLLLAWNHEYRACLLMAIKCTRYYDDSPSEFNNPIKGTNSQRLESEASSTGSQEFLTQIS